jgi:DNA-binding beta-propeller fold protein YncE
MTWLVVDLPLAAWLLVSMSRLPDAVLGPTRRNRPVAAAAVVAILAAAGFPSARLLRGQLEQISLNLFPGSPPASTPNSLAISPDGKRLLVALADSNAVGVTDVSNSVRSLVGGFIPTGGIPPVRSSIRMDVRCSS